MKYPCKETSKVEFKRKLPKKGQKGIFSPRSLSYDSMPVYDGTLDDLDLEKFRDFLTLRKHAPKGPMDVQELLRSYFLVTDERGYRYPTVAQAAEMFLPRLNV